MVAGPSISNVPVSAGDGPWLSGGGVGVVLGAALGDVSLLTIIDSDAAAPLVVSDDVVTSSVPEHAARLKAVARPRMGRRGVRRCLCIVDVL